MDLNQTSFKLKYFINKKGITIKELSKRSKISLLTIKSILENKCKNPRTSTLLALLNTLNVKFLDFVNFSYMDYAYKLLSQRIIEAEISDFFHNGF